MIARLTAILRWLTDAELAESIAGDLEEQRRVRATRSRLRATLWCAGAGLALVGQLVWLRCRRARPRLWPDGSALLVEARQAARSLVRTPATTAVIVVTLALGVGVNSAVFSIVHGVLFDPLPFERADRLVIVEGARRGQVPSVFGTSYPDYLDLARDQQSFEALATSAYWTFTLTDHGTPQRLIGLRVSGTFFPTLGMRPLLGRWITADDDRPGGPEVALISQDLWQRAFGGDPDVIGRRVTLNGQPTEVIGVMPPAFAFPVEDAELWAPMLGEMAGIPRNSRFFMTIGRLRPGATREGAGRELTALAAGLERQHPETNRDWRPVVTDGVHAITREARPRLLLLLGGVLVVLLVACANVAAIVAMRALGREPAWRLRVALGASRWRLGRMVLVETAWLALAGLAMGLLLAQPVLAVLRQLAPEELPRVGNVSLSWPVIGWAAAAMIAFAAAAALAPVWAFRGTRSAATGTATAAGGGSAWGRRTVVAAQIGGAFVLLAVAGLLLRSFARVLDVDPGFAPDRLVTVRTFLTPPAYRSLDQQIDFVRRGLEALATTPGVVSAAAISEPPFDREGGGTTLAAAVEGRRYAPGTHPSVAYRVVSPGYFRTAGIELLDGRPLTEDDRGGAPLVGVVNQAMARALWPGERAVGRRFEFADGRHAGWVTVVGVARDVATDGLESSEPPAVYAPYVQRTLPFLRWMTFVVRTDGDPAGALPAVRARLQSVDPHQPLYAASTMEAAMARWTAERRFSVVLMAAFAGLTLLLATLGMYGVLAHRVLMRRREIGVRLALGARPRQVVRLVVAEGVAVALAGVVLGAGGAVLAAPLIRGALFGVTIADVGTYGASVLVLTGATLLASTVPALTASRTDPARTLRD